MGPRKQRYDRNLPLKSMMGDGHKIFAKLVQFAHVTAGILKVFKVKESKVSVTWQMLINRQNIRR